MNPTRNPNDVMVEIRKSFIDERGEIKNLLDMEVGSIAVITSKKGAIRANHFHKTDFHYCWMQRGSVLYYQRPVGSQETPRKWHVREGEMFYSPPMYDHAMLFTSDAVMFVFAKNNRLMENYEADTVRIPSIVDPKDSREFA